MDLLSAIIKNDTLNKMQKQYMKNHVNDIMYKQECIPLGCVPSAAVGDSSWRGGVCPGGCAPPPVDRMADANNCIVNCLERDTFKGLKV